MGNAAEGTAGLIEPLSVQVIDSTSGVEKVLAQTLADLVGVEQVSVDSNFFDDLGADSMVMAQFCARVRKRAEIPSISIKDVYQHATIRSLASTLAPATHLPVERATTAAALADVLAGVVGVERVSVDSDFFVDLGADSMVMAQFCARVRKRPDLPTVSIKDIYRHSTIRSLSTALADVPPPAPEPAVPVSTEAPARAGTRQYVLCGSIQVLLFLIYSYLTASVFEQGFVWILASTGEIDIYLRSLLFGGVLFLFLATLPILAKWLLIGRWKPQQIRIWSLAYVRFWLVKTLVASNPLVLFAGSPLYVLYLRALGAKVGRGVVIFSRHLPVCTDLLTVGDGTVIRNDTRLNCYRARAGLIQTGPVTVGRNVFIGENAVLDIGTSLGDGAQLGHASALHVGQSVPVGEHWHGSPAQQTEADYRGVAPAACGTARRAAYALGQLLIVVFLYLPLATGGLALLFIEVPWLAALLEPGYVIFTEWHFYGIALVTSTVLFFGLALAGFVVVISVPRVLNLAIKPDTVYRLYGIRYAIHRTIARLTNRPFFVKLTGDSSYVVDYLQSLGYRLAPVVQTGSNFGSEVKHENPYLSAVGTGTVVASGLSVINASYSSTSFSVSRTSIGAHNFLGNIIVVPPRNKTGDNCLLATKVLVPIDGPVREGVGLLGSPSFEIPRSVERDSRFAHLATGEGLPGRLAAKNKHNLVSIGWFLLARWFYTFVLVLVGLSLADLFILFGAGAVALANILILLFSIFYLSLVERASTGFRGVQPKYCSIYDIDFWRTERFFKLQTGPGLHRIVNGTPFKALVWRLVGVRLGKRLFDDGSGMSEKNIVTIGDDVTLNAGSYIQCHSQEDYAFKSFPTAIGNDCTVGVGAMVHYGVTMGDGAVLAADSFLMKGEEMPAHSHWGGNPAREMPEAGLPDPRVPAGPQHRPRHRLDRQQPAQWQPRVNGRT